jgi:hypothetical protein
VNVEPCDATLEERALPSTAPPRAAALQGPAVDSRAARLQSLNSVAAARGAATVSQDTPSLHGPLAYAEQLSFVPAQVTHTMAITEQQKAAERKREVRTSVRDNG